MTESLLESARYRLLPGYHLVAGNEDWLLYRPDGIFVRLKVEPELAEALAAVLAGEETASSAESNGAVEALLERFAVEGIAVPEADAATAASFGASAVTVDGEGEIAERLVELLARGGLEPLLAEHVEKPKTPMAGDLWVSCAEWLPDARWRLRDAWCFENGVAWHGIYAEGCRFHLGPFWLPDDPQTARYADARARRLAAEAHPEGLEAYWRYLDAGDRVTPMVPPNPAEAALLAGALAADVLAWAAGETPPSRGEQLAYDRPTGCWRRHPVLPVPRGLMTEAVP